MNFNKSFKTLIASLTVFVFFATSLGISPNAFAVPSVAGEVSLPYRATLDRNLGFSIPSELGKIESYKPGKGPMLVHIQTAHGHYEAQQKIRQILHHLDKNYGMKTLLLEGSASELSPDFLNFFPKDPKLTQKIADTFTKHALVTGEELYLLDKNTEGGGRRAEGVKAKTPSSLLPPLSSPAVQALGIENLPSYLANGESFSATLEAKQQSGQFLKAMDEAIRRLSTPYLSTDLRSFLDNLKSFESRLMPLDAWLAFLKVGAQKHLKLDLTSHANQIEWPMLVRVFKIQELAAKLDRQKLPKEREAFLKALLRFIPNAPYPEIERLLRAERQSVPLPDPETSLLFEDMVRQLPRDFNYDAFPNVRYYIGTLLLQSELKADLLMREVETLAEKISAKLAKSSEEKELVALFTEYRLLGKLFALELTPADYEVILAEHGTRSTHHEKQKPERGPWPMARGTDMKPSAIVRRFESLARGPSPVARVKSVQFSHLPDLDRLFDLAMKFYEGAKTRDEEMMQGVERRLKETGADRAVIITGGFHAEPFREHFATGDYGYALISPRLTTSDDKGKADYVQFVMNSFVKPVKTSTYAASMQGAATDGHLPALVRKHAVALVHDELRLPSAQLAAIRDSLSGSPEADREEWERFQAESPEGRSEVRLPDMKKQIQLEVIGILKGTGIDDKKDLLLAKILEFGRIHTLIMDEKKSDLVSPVLERKASLQPRMAALQENLNRLISRYEPGVPEVSITALTDAIEQNVLPIHFHWYATDPLHGVEHSIQLAERLVSLSEQDPALPQKIDLRATVVAIFMHDLGHYVTGTKHNVSSRYVSESVLKTSGLVEQLYPNDVARKLSEILDVMEAHNHRDLRDQSVYQRFYAAGLLKDMDALDSATHPRKIADIGLGFKQQLLGKWEKVNEVVTLAPKQWESPERLKVLILDNSQWNRQNDGNYDNLTHLLFTVVIERLEGFYKTKEVRRFVKETYGYDQRATFEKNAVTAVNEIVAYVLEREKRDFRPGEKRDIERFRDELISFMAYAMFESPEKDRILKNDWLSGQRSDKEEESQRVQLLTSMIDQYVPTADLSAARSEARKGMSEKDRKIIEDFWAYLRERGLEPTTGSAGFVGVKKAGENYTGDAVEPYYDELHAQFDLKLNPDMQVSLMWPDFSADGPKGKVIERWLSDAYAEQFGRGRSEVRGALTGTELRAVETIFNEAITKAGFQEKIERDELEREIAQMDLTALRGTDLKGKYGVLLNADQAAAINKALHTTIILPNNTIAGVIWLIASAAQTTARSEARIVDLTPLVLAIPMLIVAYSVWLLRHRLENSSYYGAGKNLTYVFLGTSLSLMALYTKFFLEANGYFLAGAITASLLAGDRAMLFTKKALGIRFHLLDPDLDSGYAPIRAFLSFSVAFLLFITHLGVRYPAGRVAADPTRVEAVQPADRPGVDALMKEYFTDTVKRLLDEKRYDELELQAITNPYRELRAFVVGALEGTAVQQRPSSREDAEAALGVLERLAANRPQYVRQTAVPSDVQVLARQSLQNIQGQGEKAGAVQARSESREGALTEVIGKDKHWTPSVQARWDALMGPDVVLSESVGFELAQLLQEMGGLRTATPAQETSRDIARSEVRAPESFVVEHLRPALDEVLAGILRMMRATPAEIGTFQITFDSENAGKKKELKTMFWPRGRRMLQKEIHGFLDPRKGDTISFSKDGNRIRVTKKTPFPVASAQEQLQKVFFAGLSAGRVEDALAVTGATDILARIFTNKNDDGIITELPLEAYRYRALWSLASLDINGVNALLGKMADKKVTDRMRVPVLARLWVAGRDKAIRDLAEVMLRSKGSFKYGRTSAFYARNRSLANDYSSQWIIKLGTGETDSVADKIKGVDAPVGTKSFDRAVFNAETESLVLHYTSKKDWPLSTTINYGSKVSRSETRESDEEIVARVAAALVRNVTDDVSFLRMALNESRSLSSLGFDYFDVAEQIRQTLAVAGWDETEADLFYVNHHAAILTALTRSDVRGMAEVRTHKALLPVLLVGSALASALGAFAGSVEIRLGISGPGDLSITAPWQGDYRVESASQLGRDSNLWHVVEQFSVAGPSTFLWTDPSVGEAGQKFYRAVFGTLPLPDGWTRIGTNPNFATRIVSTYEYPPSAKVYITRNYYLKNLRTGAETLLLSWMHEGSYGGYSVNAFVDPAAKAVIFSKTGDLGRGWGYEREIYVRNLANPLLATSIPDSTAASVDFPSTFALITTGDGIVKKVDLDTMLITLSSEERAYLLARSNTDAMKRFIWGYILKRNYTELVSWASGVAPYYSLPIDGTRLFSQFAREFPVWKLQQLASQGTLQFYDAGQHFVSAQTDEASMRQFVIDYLWRRGYEVTSQGWLSGFAPWYALPNHGGRSFEIEFVPEMDLIIAAGSVVRPRSEVRNVSDETMERFKNILGGTEADFKILFNPDKIRHREHLGAGFQRILLGNIADILAQDRVGRFKILSVYLLNKIVEVSNALDRDHHAKTGWLEPVIERSWFLFKPYQEKIVALAQGKVLKAPAIYALVSILYRIEGDASNPPALREAAFKARVSLWQDMDLGETVRPLLSQRMDYASAVLNQDALRIADGLQTYADSPGEDVRGAEEVGNLADLKVVIGHVNELLRSGREAQALPFLKEIRDGMPRFDAFRGELDAYIKARQSRSEVRSEARHSAQGGQAQGVFEVTLSVQKPQRAEGLANGVSASLMEIMPGVPTKIRLRILAEQQNDKKKEMLVLAQGETQTVSVGKRGIADGKYQNVLAEVTLVSVDEAVGTATLRVKRLYEPFGELDAISNAGDIVARFAVFGPRIARETGLNLTMDFLGRPLTLGETNARVNKTMSGSTTQLHFQYFEAAQDVWSVDRFFDEMEKRLKDQGFDSVAKASSWKALRKQIALDAGLAGNISGYRSLARSESRLDAAAGLQSYLDQLDEGVDTTDINRAMEWLRGEEDESGAPLDLLITIRDGMSFGTFRAELTVYIEALEAGFVKPSVSKQSGKTLGDLEIKEVGILDESRAVPLDWISPDYARQLAEAMRVAEEQGDYERWNAISDQFAAAGNELGAFIYESELGSWVQKKRSVARSEARNFSDVNLVTDAERALLGELTHKEEVLSRGDTKVFLRKYKSGEWTFEVRLENSDPAVPSEKVFEITLGDDERNARKIVHAPIFQNSFLNGLGHPAEWIHTVIEDQQAHWAVKTVREIENSVSFQGRRGRFASPSVSVAGHLPVLSGPGGILHVGFHNAPLRPSRSDVRFEGIVAALAPAAPGALTFSPLGLMFLVGTWGIESWMLRRYVKNFPRGMQPPKAGFFNNQAALVLLVASPVFFSVLPMAVPTVLMTLCSAWVTGSNLFFRKINRLGGVFRDYYSSISNPGDQFDEVLNDVIRLEAKREIKLARILFRAFFETPIESQVLDTIGRPAFMHEVTRLTAPEAMRLLGHKYGAALQRLASFGSNPPGKIPSVRMLSRVLRSSTPHRSEIRDSLSFRGEGLAALALPLAQITPQDIVSVWKWVPLVMGAIGVALSVSLIYSLGRELVSRAWRARARKIDDSKKLAKNSPAQAVTPDESGDSAKRSELRGMGSLSSAIFALILGAAMALPEIVLSKEKDASGLKAEKTAVSAAQLIKDLQFGANAKKSFAMAEISKRLSSSDGAIPDVEVLAEKDKIVKLLLSIMKNPFGGKLSEESAMALASFGPSVVDLLLREVASGTASSKLLAVRALGLIGAPAKESAASVLKGFLRDTKLKMTSPQLVNEAVIALALLGGPYDADLMPNIVRGMIQVKDVDAQLKIALQIIDVPGVRVLNQKELEFVFLRAFQKSTDEIGAREDILKALVKINTPSSLKAVSDVLTGKERFFNYDDRIAAVKALAAVNPPSRQVLESLVATLQTEYSPAVVLGIIRILGDYGVVASTTLPALESYLKNLPLKKNLDGGEKSKPIIGTEIKAAIEKIKNAPAKPGAFAPVTNQVPQRAPGARSEVRGAASVGLESEAPWEDSFAAAAEMDDVMARQLARSGRGSLEQTASLEDSAAAVAEWDTFELRETARMKRAETEARKQDLSPKILIVESSRKGSVVSYIASQVRFLDVQKIMIYARRKGVVVGYTPMSKDNLGTEVLEARLQARGITDLSQVSEVHLEMKSPWRRSEVRAVPTSLRREKWVAELGLIETQIEGLERDFTQILRDTPTPERAERLRSNEEEYDRLDKRRVQLERYLRRPPLLRILVLVGPLAAGSSLVEGSLVAILSPKDLGRSEVRSVNLRRRGFLFGSLAMAVVNAFAGLGESMEEKILRRELGYFERVWPSNGQEAPTREKALQSLVGLSNVGATAFASAALKLLARSHYAESQDLLVAALDKAADEQTREILEAIKSQMIAVQDIDAKYLPVAVVGLRRLAADPSAPGRQAWARGLLKEFKDIVYTADLNTEKDFEGMFEAVARTGNPRDMKFFINLYAERILKGRVAQDDALNGFAPWFTSKVEGVQDPFDGTEGNQVDAKDFGMFTYELSQARWIARSEVRGSMSQQMTSSEHRKVLALPAHEEGPLSDRMRSGKSRFPALSVSVAGNYPVLSGPAGILHTALVNSPGYHRSEMRVQIARDALRILRRDMPGLVLEDNGKFGDLVSWKVVNRINGAFWLRLVTLDDEVAEPSVRRFEKYKDFFNRIEGAVSLREVVETRAKTPDELEVLLVAAAVAQAEAAYVPFAKIKEALKELQDLETMREMILVLEREARRVLAEKRASEEAAKVAALANASAEKQSEASPGVRSEVREGNAPSDSEERILYGKLPKTVEGRSIVVFFDSAAEKSGKSPWVVEVDGDSHAVLTPQIIEAVRAFIANPQGVVDVSVSVSLPSGARVVVSPEKSAVVSPVTPARSPLTPAGQFASGNSAVTPVTRTENPLRPSVSKDPVFIGQMIAKGFGVKVSFDPLHPLKPRYEFATETKPEDLEIPGVEAAIQKWFDNHPRVKSLQAAQDNTKTQSSRVGAVALEDSHVAVPKVTVEAVVLETLTVEIDGRKVKVDILYTAPGHYAARAVQTPADIAKYGEIRPSDLVTVVRDPKALVADNPVVKEKIRKADGLYELKVEKAADQARSAAAAKKLEKPAAAEPKAKTFKEEMARQNAGADYSFEKPVEYVLSLISAYYGKDEEKIHAAGRVWVSLTKEYPHLVGEKIGGDVGPAQGSEGLKHGDLQQILKTIQELLSSQRRFKIFAWGATGLVLLASGAAVLSLSPMAALIIISIASTVAYGIIRWIGSNREDFLKKGHGNFIGLLIPVIEKEILGRTLKAQTKTAALDAQDGASSEEGEAVSSNVREVVNPMTSVSVKRPTGTVSVASASKVRSESRAGLDSWLVRDTLQHVLRPLARPTFAVREHRLAKIGELKFQARSEVRGRTLEEAFVMLRGAYLIPELKQKVVKQQYQGPVKNLEELKALEAANPNPFSLLGTEYPKMLQWISSLNRETGERVLFEVNAILGKAKRLGDDLGFYSWQELLATLIVVSNEARQIRETPVSQTVSQETLLERERFEAWFDSFLTVFNPLALRIQDGKLTGRELKAFVEKTIKPFAPNFKLSRIPQDQEILTMLGYSYLFNDLQRQVFLPNHYFTGISPFDGGQASGWITGYKNVKSYTSGLSIPVYTIETISGNFGTTVVFGDIVLVSKETETVYADYYDGGSSVNLQRKESLRRDPEGEDVSILEEPRVYLMRTMAFLADKFSRTEAVALLQDNDLLEEMSHWEALRYGVQLSSAIQDDLMLSRWQSVAQAIMRPGTELGVLMNRMNSDEMRDGFASAVFEVEAKLNALSHATFPAYVFHDMALELLHPEAARQSDAQTVDSRYADARFILLGMLGQELFGKKDVPRSQWLRFLDEHTLVGGKYDFESLHRLLKEAAQKAYPKYFLTPEERGERLKSSSPQVRSEVRANIVPAKTVKELMTPERLDLIEQYYFHLVPVWFMKALMGMENQPVAVAALESWLGESLAYAGNEVSETTALESLMPQDGKLVAQDRGFASSPLARASAQNVKAASGALALESSLFQRFLNENPRALFYLLKPFAANTDGPALVTIGSPDLIGKIIEALRKKGVVDPSEVEALATVIKSLEAGTLLKVELLKPGETEASVLNKLTVANQGGIATLHLDGAMLPELKDGVHFAFEEKIGSEDLMVATVLGIALKSMADLIRNIPDMKVRGELLTKFVTENLPGVKGNGTNFVISQIAQLAQAFVQQALIAKSA